MRTFQYKILNNFLYLNEKLSKMGLVETPLCSSCKENDETLIHLFAWCPVTKNMWNRFKVWLSTDQFDRTELAEFPAWNNNRNW